MYYFWSVLVITTRVVKFKFSIYYVYSKIMNKKYVHVIL